jgi:hypothetical protein
VLDLCPEYHDIRVAKIPAALIEESPGGARSICLIRTAILQIESDHSLWKGKGAMTGRQAQPSNSNGVALSIERRGASAAFKSKPRG